MRVGSILCISLFMTTLAEFKATLEAHLKATDTPPSRFGKEVLGDPSFVIDIRKGRKPNLESVERVMKAIDRTKKKLKAKAGAAA